MAWTTPGTAVAGQVLTAAYLNENLRDNTQYLYTNGGSQYIGTYSGTAASSISAQGVFSAAFSRYEVRMVVTAVSSGTSAINLRLMSGATATSTSIYVYSGFTTATDASSGVLASTGTTSIIIWPGSGSGFTHAASTFEVINPFASTYTGFFGHSFRLHTTSIGRAYEMLAATNVTTSYDGIQMAPDSGTITASMDVYGIGPRAE